LFDSESLVLFDSLNDIDVLSDPDIASLIESLVDVESLVESDSDVLKLVESLIDVDVRSELLVLNDVEVLTEPDVLVET
ncbi:hypothetical protein, partial [Mammaliicoccus sciuri]